MSNGFKSNRAAVDRQFEKNKAAALEALGMEFTHLATKEMNRLIYDDPITAVTGRLRGGQTYQVDRQNDEVIVGNNVEYAVHVHFEGITRNWGGRPWMTNTINTRQTELQSVVEAVLGQGFN